MATPTTEWRMHVAQRLVSGALDSTSNESPCDSLSRSTQALKVELPGTSATSPASTPVTSISSGTSDIDLKSHGLDNYIALGCLCFKSIRNSQEVTHDALWTEVLHPNLPEELKILIGNEATRLLEARWIRAFLHQVQDSMQNHEILRIYLLPEDWGRRSIDRNSKSLKSALRQLLQQVDVSSATWYGDHSNKEPERFDPWATAENVSLFYLFNKLPSPAPAPEKIKNRFARRAVEDLLDSVGADPADDAEYQPVEGLKSMLYLYQARSASLMIQREAAPQLQLDPRLELRTSPTGRTFYFGARDGSFLHDAKYYEGNRGGILAETMGLGKTIICLSVILATKGHLPQIPVEYQRPAKVRSQVGSLKDMAAGTLARYTLPARELLERYEAYEDLDLRNLKHVLERNAPFYEIPPELPRMNRNTHIPLPRQLAMGSGTIVVVPRNLLHQWQSEIRKHVTKDALKILIVDTVPKRARKTNKLHNEDYAMEFVSELPTPTKLLEYNIVLFTRNRFEQEIQGESGESPLKKIHWLRIIIDEGHSFSSSFSNAVIVAKQLKVERRWIVSGTPAKDLVGVEVDLATSDELSREVAVEVRKAFTLDDDNTKAAKALGTLASNFLMVRPWADSATEGHLDWDDYIYRHEHIYRKTYSGFSSCFLRTLEGLVVKTRPDDVAKDITLPPKRHKVVYLKPCWFDKMVQNLFVQVLRANAITSERSDVDYLFHKNSIKARHSLIRNLRQSNFTWTGFSLEDVATTLETSAKYLDKEDKNCSLEDANLLLESSRIVSMLTASESWIALSKAHEVGIAIENWPIDSEESFTLSYSEKPTMVGITQLLQGQAHVDSQILSENPSEGLELVGQIAREKILAMQQAENETKKFEEQGSVHTPLKAGVPSSCVGSQPITSRRASVMAPKASPRKPGAINTQFKPPSIQSEETRNDSIKFDDPNSPTKPKKRKLTLADEMATLPPDHPLSSTRILGTTSAKLSYIIGKVVEHQSHSKLLIFYDGDNTAFYLAQALEMLYINYRIYARTLDNTTRSKYVALFNSDPDIRVLLIDVACGALGLNLNAASVVIIVNPINRPAIEAQAIKRCHRIGQTKDVLVETLVLEGTMEEAIFKQAKQMSRQQHLEAKELEDDAGIMDIIQHAKTLPIAEGEEEGFAKFAPLGTPQQVFGRPDRNKYHHYLGKAEKEKPKKKARVAIVGERGGSKSTTGSGKSSRVATPAAASPKVPADTQTDMSLTRHEPGQRQEHAPRASLFGG